MQNGDISVMAFIKYVWIFCQSELGLSKKWILNIHRIKKKSIIHIRLQKRCIRILGLRQPSGKPYQWHTKWDDDVSVIAFLMLLLAYPVEPAGCGAATLFIQYIAVNERRASVWRRCCLRQNWNQAVHTERILITSSRWTFISDALASHTKKNMFHEFQSFWQP